MSESPAATAEGTLPGAGLAGHYSKTEAGRAEIRNRALPLSRPARNLLLIIDASRSGEGWLGVVQGCVGPELAALVEHGLVAEAPAGVSVAANPAAAPRMSLAQALESRSYKALYDRITSEARPRLGLIKGYRMILEVERCGGPADVRALAQRFVDMVRESQGDTAGMALAQVLIAPE